MDYSIFMGNSSDEGDVMKILQLLLILAIAGSSLFGISIQERIALRALYDSTDGDNWTDNSNWHFDFLGTSNPCTDDWYDIFSVSLSGNNLTGSIPPEIGDLSKLRFLVLRNNFLSGTIPSEIRFIGDEVSFGSSMGIDLGNNQFTGSIPPQIGDIFQLFTLFLQDNQLSGVIPEEIGNLKDLTNLDISSNYLGTNDNASDLGDWLDDFYAGGRQAFLSSQRIVAPTKLGFTNTTSTSVTLNWHDNSDNEKGFRIFQNGNEIHITGMDETSFTVTGLTTSTAYTFEVKATDEILYEDIS